MARRGCRIAVVWVAASCSDFVRLLSCILARRACSVGFASCLVSRLGCHIVWQLSAAGFKHPCLKLLASTITHPCVCGRWGRHIVQRLCATAIVHPCTTRTVRVRPPAPKKQGYACLGITLLFWCRWRGSNPHGIATNGF